jgi:hypothetical protein
MSIREQICEAYEMLTDSSQDTEGVHIHLTTDEGTPEEEEAGIIEFLDEDTIYVENYGDETSDVRDVSDMSEMEFKKFVLSVVSV